MSSKQLKLVFLVLGVIVFVIIYKTFNPVENEAFPKCIIHSTTGYECPGCGSQRAIHYVLNLQIGKAFAQNPLLVSLIPYLLIGFFLDYAKQTASVVFWRKTLYGIPAILIVLLLVIGFTLWRNGIL